MPEVEIETLNVAIWNASGHEHRVGGIAGRAASIFSVRLSRQLEGGTAQPKSIDDVGAAAPLQFDLRSISDEQAANEIASAWLEAVRLRLKL